MSTGEVVGTCDSPTVHGVRTTADAPVPGLEALRMLKDGALGVPQGSWFGVFLAV